MRLAALFLFAAFTQVHAGERYRFHCGDGITGISTSVSDKAGAETTIRFAEDSDKRAMFLLNNLIDLEGISGSLKPQRDTRGVSWDQAIVLVGDFSSPEKKTVATANAPAQEAYREFKVTDIELHFPFAQWIQIDKDDPIDSPYSLMFHFSARSLFPNGLKYQGRDLALERFEKRSRSEQGGAGNPLDAQ